MRCCRKMTRSLSEARSQATHEAAMAIIAAEKKKRDEKTARLRMAREAADAQLGLSFHEDSGDVRARSQGRRRAQAVHGK